MVEHCPEWAIGLWDREMGNKWKDWLDEVEPDDFYNDEGEDNNFEVIVSQLVAEWLELDQIEIIEGRNLIYENWYLSIENKKWIPMPEQYNKYDKDKYCLGKIRFFSDEV